MKGSKQKKVLLVCTREFECENSNGRIRSLKFIKYSLEAAAEVSVIRLTSFFESPSLIRLLRCLKNFMFSLFSGHPEPLQVLLFFDPCKFCEIRKRIEYFQPDCIYFDTIRCGPLMIYLRTFFPDIKFVMDFDDLMSLRFRNLVSEKSPITLGYLGRYTTTKFNSFFSSHIVAFLLKRYEALTLGSYERKVSDHCDVITLVSRNEAELFRNTSPGSSVATIPPHIDVKSPFSPLLQVNRFVFLGSNTQLQNRVVLDYLFEKWEILAPSLELHVYGQQHFLIDTPDGVIVRGYVDDLSEVFMPGTIMLYPALISGGVKTKVLDAFSFGIIVIGNGETFSGLDANLDFYNFSEIDFDSFICSPERWVQQLNEYGNILIPDIQKRHNASVISERWRHLCCI